MASAQCFLEEPTGASALKRFCPLVLDELFRVVRMLISSVLTSLLTD